MIDHDVRAYIADMAFFQMEVEHQKEVWAGSKNKLLHLTETLRK
jgi:hypothetical protein